VFGPQELDYVKSSEAIDFVRRIGSIPPQSFEALFPKADEEALDLLHRMLDLYPPRRITVQAAMDHPYFDAVREMYSEEDPVMPDSFEFEFEKSDLTVAEFRELIRQEALSFKREREERVRRRKGKSSSSSSSSAPPSSSSSGAS
jgi:serine/threonine protein kinase